RAHAATGSDHQHRLTWLQVRVVAERLEGGTPRDGNRRGLFERDVRRLARELVRACDCELGERPSGEAHDLVARTELGHVRADGVDASGGVPASGRLHPLAYLWAEASEVRLALHQVPHIRTAAGRPHLYENVVLPNHRIRHVPKLEYLCSAKPVLHDRLHSGLLALVYTVHRCPETMCTPYTCQPDPRADEPQTRSRHRSAGRQKMGPCRRPRETTPSRRSSLC